MKSSDKEIELNKIKSSVNGCVYDFYMDKFELLKIKLHELLCVRIMGRKKSFALEFETKYILKAILGKYNPCIKSALIEQFNLQQNLKYNLDNKVKIFMKEPNLNEELDQQFNNMKKRLLNEINLPRLIQGNLPKYKNYY